MSELPPNNAMANSGLRRMLLAVLVDFISAYTDIELDLEFDNRKVDVIDGLMQSCAVGSPASDNASNASNASKKVAAPMMIGISLFSVCTSGATPCVESVADCDKEVAGRALAATPCCDKPLEIRIDLPRGSPPRAYQVDLRRIVQALQHDDYFRFQYVHRNRFILVKTCSIRAPLIAAEPVNVLNNPAQEPCSTTTSNNHVQQPRQAAMPFKPKQRNACDSIALPTRCLPAIGTVSLSLQGCTQRGAPSYEIFGAYFPLWLLCAVIGLVGTLIAHRIFVSTGWVRVVPFQLLVCVAIGMTVSVLCWLSGTGQLL